MAYREIGALAAVLALIAAPAQAQGDEGALRGQLRACALIAEVPARVACYDALAADEPPVAAQVAAPAAQATPPPPAGFGSEQVPRARTPEAARASEPERAEAIEVKVASVVQREPGIHLLTLEDGAQWQFVESVPLSYNPPRRGSTVEIRSATMGGYMMRFQGQSAVRVRRVR